MADQIKVALLQNDQSSFMPGLHLELRAQNTVVQVVRGCNDLASLFSAPEPPEVILTDLVFPDGTWEDVVRIGQNSPMPVSVVVVSRHADIRLYVEVLEKGAFDFVTPPFESSQVSYVLRSAFLNAAIRREAQSRAALLRESRQQQLALAVAS